MPIVLKTGNHYIPNPYLNLYPNQHLSPALVPISCSFSKIQFAPF